MIDMLQKLFDRFGKNSGTLEETLENEGSEQHFETPDMDEVLSENQTAEEL